MKKLIVGAVLALAIVAFLPRPASAGPGLVLQGVEWNGINFNGPGLVLQGAQWNGITNGWVIQGLQVKGQTWNGALLQAGERPVAAPRCSEAGVDFSAVPLAKVTVRLPPSVR